MIFFSNIIINIINKNNNSNLKNLLKIVNNQLAYALSARQKNYVRVFLAASFGYYTNYMGYRDVK